jgi:3-hydroxyisobutyrate dehydrogenase
LNSLSVSPATTKLGWIGTGVMGRSMCGHLIKAGFSMTVFNRSQTNLSELLQVGARVAGSPQEVASQSDIVFVMVGYPHDVREVILGERGVLSGFSSHGIVVDMTTSSPRLAVEIAEAAQTKGCQALDAPVSGGDIGAREARLSIMVGGDQPTFEALNPCWQAMGKTILFQGGPGSGQHTKMVNQILIANNMVGLCEAMLYAYRSGLDPVEVLKSVSSGAAGSWSLTNLAPRVLNNDFAPGFYVEHFVKDMGIALEEARRMNLALPGLALAHQLYVALTAQGMARLGTQALIQALGTLSGLDWRNRPTRPEII